MTLQNDVLNPGPLLNQHPRKACKSMRARVGRPCCGGYPCQPPKMHQISKEVVRDWSLWGSWCFSIFLMISRNLLRQEDARRQKLLLHVLMWMMLMNAYDLCNAFLSRIHLVFLHNDSSCILLYLFCLNFIPWTPTQKKDEQPPWPWRQKQDTGAAPDWGTIWTSAGSSEAGCQK